MRAAAFRAKEITMMTNSKVKSALHILKMLYQDWEFFLGISRSYAAQGKEFLGYSKKWKRKALSVKCKAIVWHDRVLTGDNHG